MDITVKYNRKNFFNSEDYMEDIKKNCILTMHYMDFIIAALVLIMRNG